MATRIDVTNEGWNFTLTIVCDVPRRSFLHDQQCLSSIYTDEMFVPVKRQQT